MGEIVEGKFKQKVEVVYECARCEGQSFWLDEEGTITCRACKAKQIPPQIWIDKLVENAAIE